MLPETPVRYPSFVADQLLTADHLNGMFHYLDEQSRLTRANLIGVGIVCGLQVSVNAENATLTISKGCGITTEGYLISIDEQTFSGYRSYNALQPDFYIGFVSGAKAQKFSIDELMASAVDDDVNRLNNDYLKDKVVLLFVELLRSNAKNCDADSCDDKGGKVDVAYKPLIVNKNDAELLKGDMAGAVNTVNQAYFLLPELHAPRYDVKATSLVDSSLVLNGFITALKKSFLDEVQNALNAVYNMLKPLLQNEYVTNPFQNFVAGLSFIENGGITTKQALQLQYTFDFVNDVVKAYTELKDQSLELYCQCMPDNKFPRHLLLDEVSLSGAVSSSVYRHHFLASPVTCQNRLTANVVWMFRRIVLMINNFKVPEPAFVISKIKPQYDYQVRVTPSLLGNEKLDDKAIPYYYRVNDGTVKLYQNWNYKLSRVNLSHRILSYHSKDYNLSEPFVYDPLGFDLEKYNFFRIEGHLGKHYANALKSIKSIQKDYRLPFEVVAMSANVSAIREETTAVTKPGGVAALKSKYAEEIKSQCTFQDLEAQYDSILAELKCSLCKEMKYFYSISSPGQGELENNIPAVSLLMACDPSFRVSKDTIGQSFERYWKSVKDKPYIGFRAFTTTFSLAATATNGNALYSMLYYIEMLSQQLVDNITDFNSTLFNNIFADLQRAAQYVKASNASSIPDAKLQEEVIDHLDRLVSNCKAAAINALFSNYYLRWIYVIMLRKFGHYILSNPGVEHKAGVSKGGTFILVYHEDEEKASARLGSIVNITTAITEATLSSGAASAIKPSTLVFNPAVTTVATGVTVTGTGYIKPDRLTLGNSISAIENSVVKNKINPSAINSIPTIVTGLKKGAKGKEADVDLAASAKASFNASDLKTAASFSAVSIADKINLISGTKLNFLNEFVETNTKPIPAAQLGALNILFDAIVRPRLSFADKVEALEDGVVIADFYLPYIAASECPPVQFNVVDGVKEEPGTQPTISIEQTVFCNKDESSFEVSVSPADGELVGEGIEKGQDGKYSFQPSKVIITDAKNKKVVLKYTVDGRSSELPLLVHADPDASFSINSGQRYSVRVLKNTSRYSDTATWDFGDGGKLDGNEVVHDFLNPGKFRITLFVKNGICESSFVQEIEIVEPPTGPDEKECLSVINALEGFKKLPSFKNLYSTFIKSYKSYPEIDQFFSVFMNMKEKDTEAYLDFFVEEKIAEKMKEWLTGLTLFKMPDREMRVITFAMLNVLSSLVFYIACLNNGDVDKKEKIELVDVLELLEKILVGIKGQSGNFSKAEAAIIKELADIITTERSSLVTSGEAKTKKVYAGWLAKMIKLFSVK